MKEFLNRSALMFGEDAIDKLENCRVAVFGLGGVGGHVAEALARGGIGEIDVIDKDVIDITNINRQILATTKNIGLNKVDIAKERLTSINPNVKVNSHNLFFLPECADKFDFSVYDYVVDAIDTVTAKILLAEKCSQSNTPLISVMGTGNKFDSTLYNTSICPLARVMRKELKSRGIKSLKVVYSKEEPIVPQNDKNAKGKPTVSSNSFVPAVAGLIAAGEVIKDLIKRNENLWEQVFIILYFLNFHLTLSR